MSLSPLDWAQRYQSGDTPWDLGAAHPELIARIAAGELRSGPAGRRALVGGAGRGHDALALAQAGFEVTAIDLVDAGAGELAARLAALGGTFCIEDALLHVAKLPYDLIFEHTFFCAIDPSLRPRWGELVSRSLASDGRLCALVFPVGKPASEGGPPYGTTSVDIAAALGAKFKLAVDEPVRQAVTRRNWPERWAEFFRAR